MDKVRICDRCDERIDGAFFAPFIEYQVVLFRYPSTSTHELCKPCAKEFREMLDEWLSTKRID